MSVIIKGMQMPTSCTMCWLNTLCGVWNIETVKHKGFNKRLDDCPLTELIRCKDCKYVGSDATCCLVCNREGMGLRPFHVYHDDFCSYAVRKEK